MRPSRATPFLLLAFVVSLTVAAGAAPQQPVTDTAATAPVSTAERLAVREELVQLLESDTIVRVDYQAVTYEGAVALIETTVDTYLDSVLADGFDPSRASRYGTAVINGLNDHRITYLDKTPFAPAIVIDSPSEAEALGDVLHLLAGLADRLGEHDALPISIRATSRAVLADVVVESGIETPIVDQYREQLRTIAARDDDALKGYQRLVRR